MAGKECEVERESPADRPRGVVCEKCLVFRMKAANDCDVISRQWARGRRERRKSKSNGKRDERAAKRKSDGSKTRKEKQNIRKGSQYVLKQLTNVQRNIWPRTRNGGRHVEYDVHDTRLTGAMVARACGAHQGAEVTSAGFEASGDLQTASEEKDDDRRGGSRDPIPSSTFNARTTLT